MSFNIAAGIGATVALSAARMYREGASDYSVWCAVGGLAVAAIPYVIANLPSQLANLLSDRTVGGYVITESMLLTAIFGAIAYEMAFDGALSAADVSVSGAVRAATGAVCAVAGSRLGVYAAGLVGY